LFRGAAGNQRWFNRLRKARADRPVLADRVCVDDKRGEVIALLRFDEQLGCASGALLTASASGVVSETVTVDCPSRVSLLDIRRSQVATFGESRFVWARKANL